MLCSSMPFNMMECSEVKRHTWKCHTRHNHEQSMISPKTMNKMCAAHSGRRSTTSGSSSLRGTWRERGLKTPTACDRMRRDGVVGRHRHVGRQVCSDGQIRSCRGGYAAGFAGRRRPPYKGCCCFCRHRYRRPSRVGGAPPTVG